MTQENCMNELRYILPRYRAIFEKSNEMKKLDYSRSYSPHYPPPREYDHLYEREDKYALTKDRYLKSTVSSYPIPQRYSLARTSPSPVLVSHSHSPPGYKKGGQAVKKEELTSTKKKNHFIRYSIKLIMKQIEIAQEDNESPEVIQMFKNIKQRLLIDLEKIEEGLEPELNLFTPTVRDYLEGTKTLICKRKTSETLRNVKISEHKINMMKENDIKKCGTNFLDIMRGFLYQLVGVMYENGQDVYIINQEANRICDQMHKKSSTIKTNYIEAECYIPALDKFDANVQKIQIRDILLSVTHATDSVQPGINLVYQMFKKNDIKLSEPQFYIQYQDWGCSIEISFTIVTKKLQRVFKVLEIKLVNQSVTVQKIPMRECIHPMYDIKIPDIDVKIPVQMQNQKQQNRSKTSQKVFRALNAPKYSIIDKNEEVIQLDNQGNKISN